jgi:hypothetical protein
MLSGLMARLRGTSGGREAHSAQDYQLRAFCLAKRQEQGLE